MRYEEAKPLIKSGDLLAWTHTSWGSWYDIQVQAVRFFTRSEYCHVGLAWKWGKRLLVIDAVSGGVRLYPLSRLGDFYWIPMDAPWKHETQEAALSLLGMPYSKWECVKAYLDDGPPEENGVMQCAKCARQILLADGIDLGPKATPNAVVQRALELRDDLIFVKGA